ncbi:MAG: outer membrane beta-barrel family protein [Bacteroidia bacterium]|nr:outer membrane beta-barrel family protein [Bacteroidia bacterium]
MCYSSDVLAQQRAGTPGTKPGMFKITGKVVSSEGQTPLEYATVTLLRTQDSVGINGGVTDANGLFDLEAAAGEYILRINFLGFESQFIPGILVDKEHPKVTLPEITLSTKATTLDAVEISAEKSRMEFALDKKIFNVGKDLSNNGGTASDLLDNIPSVTVDIEGQVSLRGSSGVRLLINGKPSGFTSVNSADALKQLPANMIEKVEIITNPSARYEAEGSVGIINIILKTERRQGWNGTFDLTGGWPQSHNASVNLNYRKEKFNFFTSTGMRYRWTPRFSNEYREIFNADTSYYQDQAENSYRGGLSGNLRMGAGYQFDEYTNLTGSVLFRKGFDANEGTIQYFNYDFLKVLENIVLRKNDEKENDFSLDYSLNFARNFKQKDRKLTADFIYNRGGETEEMDAVEENYDAYNQLLGVPDLLQRTRNGEDEKEMTLQIDYVHPIGKEGKFEAGYRTGIRNIDNTYKVEEYNNELDQWNVLEDISNEFLYNEQIHALYAIYGNKYKKFSYQFGLRGELTDITTVLETTDERNDRDYANLFPSTFLNYQINEGNALQVSYSRRLRRPNFWDLNPFFTYSNPLSIRSGNPNLNPEFSHSFDFGHIKYWEDASFSSSIYYRHTDGVFSHISTVSDDGVSISRPENLNTRDDIGLEFSLNFSPIKKWDVTWSGNFFQGRLNAENLGFANQTNFFSYTSRLNSKISLPKNFDIQVMVNYRGPEKTPQGKRYQTLYTDAGISKDILKQKGTINFRMTDIFNTSLFRFESSGENFYIYREGQWRQRRQVFVSFTYRINQEKDKRGQRQRDGGGDFEGGDDR